MNLDIYKKFSKNFGFYNNSNRFCFESSSFNIHLLINVYLYNNIKYSYPLINLHSNKYNVVERIINFIEIEIKKLNGFLKSPLNFLKIPLGFMKSRKSIINNQILNKFSLINRIRNIRSYIDAEIGKSSCAYKIIDGFIKKIAPQYEKKDPNLLRGAGKSPSEKSYVALNGYGTQTSKLINDLGTAYNPQNKFIKATEFGTFVNDMIKSVTKIAELESILSDAIKVRYEIYYGKDGLLDRQSIIKEYLASFTGGKKNQSYLEYDRLIKGK